MIVRNLLQPASAFRLPALAVCLLFSPCTCLSQSDSLNDAHVVPRASSGELKPASAGVPALSASLKPFRADVDLVLVPVTVTGRLNDSVPVTGTSTSTTSDGKGRRID